MIFYMVDYLQRKKRNRDQVALMGPEEAVWKFYDTDSLKEQGHEIWFD